MQNKTQNIKVSSQFLNFVQTIPDHKDTIPDHLINKAPNPSKHPNKPKQMKKIK